MHSLAIVLFAVVVGLNLGCGSTKRTSNPADTTLHHYFDGNGTSLPQWDFIWDQLFFYYGSNTPDRITVNYWNGSTSQFSPGTDSIRLNSGNVTAKVVAHESAHLCNYNLTNGVSDTNSFRFVDEGFAEILGDDIAGEGDWYKAYTLAVAEEENQKGNVSVALVQDWSTYYGASGSDTSTRNWRAYQVGSSFEYMIEDTRGSDAFHSFLVDIGVTRDLAATVQNVFSSTESAIEQEWKDYLDQVQIDTSVPTVVAMSPVNMATDVSLDTSEIFVAFSIAMGSTICVTTPCGDTGICYTNAYWKAHNVLAIKADAPLKPAYTYKLVLGGETSGCQLESYAGTPLPFSNWQFTTTGQ